MHYIMCNPELKLSYIKQHFTVGEDSRTLLPGPFYDSEYHISKKKLVRVSWIIVNIIYRKMN